MGRNEMTFKPGHKGLKKKGTIHEKTKVLQKVGLTSWQEFGEWIDTAGIERFKQEMQSLTGKDYIVAMSVILEYYKPKQIRSSVSTISISNIDSINFI